MLESNTLNPEIAETSENPVAPSASSSGNFIPLTALVKSAEPRLDLAQVREKLSRKSGSEYWRSLEEVCETPEFTRYLSREFPNQAPRDMAPLARRDFLKLMGASLALAGVGGCAFQPPEQIVPYIKNPEEMIPGVPLYYATAMTMSGYAHPLLGESNMGRPTKLEGNPDHPASQGRASAMAQAALLSLYDPDRSQTARSGGDAASWAQFVGVLDGLMTAQQGSRGAGLRVLTETVSSPTMAAMMRRVQARFPQMRWVQYEPVNRDNAREGAILAFGRDVHALYRFDRAQVIVSLDADFLLEEPNHVRHGRDFIRGRRPQSGRMNRLYAAYSTPNNTMAMADHRLPLRASEVEQLARVLAERMGVAGVTGDGKVGGNAQGSAKWIETLVSDLEAARGAGLVIAGSHQPPAVHALAHAINERLGNIGSTVELAAPIVAQPSNQLNDLRRLASDMNAGRVETLVILDANPVYTAPADLKFAQAMKRVENTIHLGAYDDETGVQSKWHIPQAHFLEAWGDTRSYDGTVTLQQPLISPLYEASRSPLEVVNVMAGLGDSTSFNILRSYWEQQRGGAMNQGANGNANASAVNALAGGTATANSSAAGAASTRANGNGTAATAGGAATTSGTSSQGATPGMGTTFGGTAPSGGAATSGAGITGGGAAASAATAGGMANGQMTRQSAASIAFDKTWQKFVHDGFVPGTEAKPLPQAPRVLASFAAALPAARTTTGTEINFRPDPTIYDGRFANNAWLQELPKPLTKLTWDNAAMMSIATAEKLSITLREGSYEEVNLTYRGQSLRAMAMVVPGHPDESVTLHFGYGRVGAGKLAEGNGFNAYALRQSSAPSFDGGLEMAKTGARKPLAVTANHNIIDTSAGTLDGTHGRDIVRVGTFAEMQRKEMPVNPEVDRRGLPMYKQYMASNTLPHNISKTEGHGEGHGDDHGAGEGADVMEPNGFPSLYPENVDVTQRHKDPNAGGNAQRPYAWGMAIDLTSCIGCNACVIGCQSENNIAVVGKDQVLMNRQMQWIRIDAYYKGEVESPDVHFQPMTCMHCEKAPCEPVCPVNASVHSPEGLNEQVYNRCVGTKYCSNNCPYKVRHFNFLQYSDQDTPQIQLMHNPEVTVRARGVMEKCTYCVQRIQRAKIQAEKEERPIRDGDVVTACQQTCPTDAIVFGDINDPNSRVRKIKDSQLTYGVLTELNTVPRTTYTAKIVNPNEAARPSSEVSTYGERVKGSHDSGGVESAHGDTKHQAPGHGEAAH